MQGDKGRALKEIAAALEEYERLKASSRHADCSDQPLEVAWAVINQMASAIDRFAPPGSFYRRSLARAGDDRGRPFFILQPIGGALMALRTAFEREELSGFAELVHADVFSDLLDSSQHLLESGYKDPAAVIAGSVLEQHLRELARKMEVEWEVNGKAKRADAINVELAKAGAFSKTDQKSVTAWLGLRNEAAHGNYDSYDEGQVSLMIRAVRDFVARNPA